MTDSKVIVWLLAFAFIVGAAGFVVYTTEVDDINRELLEEQTSLKSIEGLMQAKKQTLAQKEADNAAEKRDALAIEEIDTKIAAALEQRDAANKKLEELEAQPNKLAAELSDAIQSVRKAAIGKEFSEVKTTAGAVLQNARIQKITDADITLAHSVGIAKLNAKTAPREMVSRFRIKPDAELAAIARAKAAEAAEAAGAATSSTSGSAAPTSIEPPSPSTTSAGSDLDDAAKQAAIAKVRELDNRMGELAVQIRLAIQNKSSWIQQADDYRSLHYRAQALGRSSSHLIRANDATSRANAIQSQIDAAQLTMEKLRQQRNEAQSKVPST